MRGSFYINCKFFIHELAIGSLSGFAYYPPSCAYSMFQTAGLPLLLFWPNLTLSEQIQGKLTISKSTRTTLQIKKMQANLQLVSVSLSFFHLILRHIYFLSFLRRSLSLIQASSEGVSLILKVEGHF